MTRKLMYIMDAQCGWCYGNSNNIQAIYESFKDKIEFEFLNGGMWLGEQAPKAGKEISDYIGTHLPRLIEYTGVEVSDNFKELIANSSYTLSSLEPSAAVVLLKKMKPNQAFEIAKEIQKILFIEGKTLDDITSYIEVLNHFEIDQTAFENEWLSESNLRETYQEFQKAQSLTRSYPTLILQEEDQMSLLASGYFEVNKMKKALSQILG